jgi:pimeloyl-ACP methyl ester carboxylesterase
VDISKIVADRIQLPDGRYVAYCEWGATNDTAQNSVLVLHDFLSSRLAGIPGVSEKLLVTYGVRLVSYDRPGFGQSDPHPHRSFNSSAEDIVRIADALNLGQKFWVLAFSGGGPHAWAALKYIPERLAGVVMIAPAGNPYAKNMTVEETKEIWGTLPRTQKNMFRLARYFPSLLPNFLKKTVKKINGIMRSIKKIVSEKVQYPTLLGMNCLLTAGHEFAHVSQIFCMEQVNIH